MRSGTRTAVIGGVFTAVVGVAGYGVYDFVSEPAGSASTASAGAQDEEVKTGPPSAAEVRDTARDFLAAWAAGEPRKAAALTDDSTAAAAALTGYRKDAHVAKVALKQGTPSGAKVPFAVTADIAYESEGRTAPLSSTLAYESALTVVRDKTTGKPLVEWQPSVVHPELGEGDTLVTGESKAPPIKAVDRDGRELTKEDHPQLANILAALRERYGDKAGGKPAVEVFVQREEGDKEPDKTLKELAEGVPGELETTLDAGLQAAAEKAVAGHPKAAAVAVQPSTGEILAIANTPADGYNIALQGSLAPGSTMKVVSTSLLLEKGLASPEKAHPCPKYAEYGGWKFQNLDKFEIKNGTFSQSFARSCNTAFITQAEKLADDALTKQARDVFGIGLNWQTGVTTFDGAVPVQKDAPKAASLIGQGGVRMNPLTMASVSATVKSGVFRQPVLVPASVDDRKLAKAPRTMSGGTAEQLRGLMRLTATSGTAAEAMAGLGGDIGGKTGSAEVDGQKKPNGWFTAYRDDVAAAAVVPQGGHGGSSAGPVVAKILGSAG
ncbi:penicillin-binding transpeptidase domain-containing protein [Streptomyces sp. Ru87]|uniref:penicillin-binding transpeptidase domain-containing protein n=1 Tax=Streptomyces sp. Ru87 TaxID=2044307 RepID=UPI000BF9C48C|nr:penicillin-binding transpeptidase domain-containing protein [Streptomyces sp. Ru87]PGH47060.1 penicillin-binding protein [Streptomyces sp. Ru87]